MRRPSCGDLGRVGRHRARRHAAEVGVVGPVRGPADEPAVDEARRDERDVVEVRAARERIVERRPGRPGATSPPQRVDRGRAPTPASTRGAPGCARPARAARPSAVNSAAEQSARSLMFGLNAARRSTAPISSAMPVRRAISTCSDAGSSALTRHRPGARSSDASAPSGAGLGAPAVGHPDRAVGLGDDRGPAHALDAGDGQVSSIDAARRRPGRAARSATTSTGVAGARVAVAPLVLGVERRRRRARVSSWLWPA